jgi:hypothetical protein
VLPSSRALASGTRALLLTALGLVVLLVLLAATPAPVAANDPSELERAEERRGGPSPEGPRGRRTLDPQESPTAQPASPSLRPTPIRYTPPRGPEIGHDISYPQCGGSYPELRDFAIVGVNGGRVYRANPCLGAGEHPSQLEWAGPDVHLYINTGNPGPRLSSYWPVGQREPRECGTGWFGFVDSRDCAFVYGWNAAADSYRTALEAFISVGWLQTDATRLPDGITWWLDVETANSWRTSHALNVATLEGAVAFLESMEVSEVGFYSTPRLWARIVGRTDAFADYPAWHGGARNLDDALRRCDSEPAFTGGELQMVQWIEDGFDFNVRCP